MQSLLALFTELFFLLQEMLHEFLVFFLSHLRRLYFGLARNLLRLRSGLSDVVATVANFVLALGNGLLKLVGDLALRWTLLHKLL